MGRNSYERLKSIQRSLIELGNSLEEQYTLMRKECLYEIVDDVREHATQHSEMRALYNKIANDSNMRMTWIRNKLPWYITYFFKISSTEIILKDTSIFIGVNFGKSKKANCYIEITPFDIGWR